MLQVPPAGGQEPSVRALSPAEAEQARMRRAQQAAPATYVDKVMNDDALPGTEAAPPEGDFRAWFAETRVVATSARGDGAALRSSRELGESLGYRRQTLSHGDYELLADLRAADGASSANPGNTRLAGARRSGRLTLRSIAFPLDTRTFADTSVGDTFSEVTDGLSRNYRLSLGTRPVRGLSARVHGADFDLRAGTGRRGELLGGPFAGFEPTGGTLSWLGATRRTAAGVFALQANAASGEASGLYGTRQEEEVRSVAASWRRPFALGAGQSLTTRLVAIRSETDTRAGAAAGPAQGWFAEATLQSDTTRQEFGVFSADPHLRFGDARIYDARGAYWRIDRSGGRLNWGLGAQVDDQVAQPTLPASRRYGLQANAQYQVDRRHALGASISLDERREGARADGAEPGHSRSTYLHAWFQRHPARGGRSLLLLTVRRNQALVVNGGAATGEELAWEQEWLAGGPGSGRPELVTTLGIARDRDDGDARLSPTAGLRLAWDPAPRWNLSANLRYTSTHSNLATTQGLSGYADTSYAFDNGWRLGASVTLNQVASRLDGPALLPGEGPQLFRTRDSYLLLWARWEGAAGTTAAGLGAGGGAIGAGALQGRVWFDENRDGQPQANEPGVAGVEVVLDGRFRTTTDNFGRYAFPLVATGPHRVAVRPESVPLPWGPAGDAGWRTEVPLRGLAHLDLPVVKVGE